MQEMNFGAAPLFSKHYRALAEQVEDTPLAPAAVAFTRNMDRVFGLGANLIDMVALAGMLGNLACQAKVAAGYAGDDPTGDDDPAVHEIRDGLITAFAESKDPGGREIFWRTGEVAIDNFINAMPAFYDGAEAMLASMIINGWMAFECLAGDLWIAMLNRHPMPLASNAIGSNHASDEERASGQQERSLTLSMLGKYQFDVANKMGDILSQHNKYKMDSTKAIVQSYRAAFKDDWVDGVLDRAALGRVEAVRNLYAHRGGVIDAQFIRRMSNVEFVMPLEIGQTLNLTGPNVASMLNTVVYSAVSLMLFCGRWINERSEPKSGDLFGEEQRSA